MPESSRTPGRPVREHRCWLKLLRGWWESSLDPWCGFSRPAQQVSWLWNIESVSFSKWSWQTCLRGHLKRAYGQAQESNHSDPVFEFVHAKSALLLCQAPVDGRILGMHDSRPPAATMFLGTDAYRRRTGVGFGHGM